MNRLSFINNWLKLKIVGKLLIILEIFYRIYPNLILKKWRISTCNRLDLQTQRSQLISHKISPSIATNPTQEKKKQKQKKIIFEVKLSWHPKPLGPPNVHMVDILQFNMYVLCKISRVLSWFQVLLPYCVECCQSLVLRERFWF